MSTSPGSKTEKREREEDVETPQVTAGGEADAPNKRLKVTEDSPAPAETAPPTATVMDVTTSEKTEESKEEVATTKDEGTAAAEAPAEGQDKSKDGEEDKQGGKADGAADKEKAKVEPKTEDNESPLTAEEAEVEVLKLLEFYFGNSNFAWDRFMQSKAGEYGEGFVATETLLLFNKVKIIVRRAKLTQEDAITMMAKVADGSDKLKVSEDRKEIGRKEPLTDEINQERISRTVKASGFEKDMTIEAAEEFFKDAGKPCYVKIIRTGRKPDEKRVAKMFVEFETKEGAEAAMKKQYTHDGATISVENLPPKSERSDKKKPEPEPEPEAPAPVQYEPGKIIHIAGIPSEDVSREFLKAKMSDYGTPKYIDFRFGAVEAWIRFDEASEAAAAVEATKDGLPMVTKEGTETTTTTVTLVEGDDEKAYYEKMEAAKFEKYEKYGNKNSNKKGMRGGRGGRGGRGRSRGRGRR